MMVSLLVISRPSSFASVLSPETGCSLNGWSSCACARFFSACRCISGQCPVATLAGSDRAFQCILPVGRVLRKEILDLCGICFFEQLTSWG
jgi:hypothetical protein